MLFETHHIAMDGFSAELMIQEFNKLYAGEVLEDPKFNIRIILIGCMIRK